MVLPLATVPQAPALELAYPAPQCEFGFTFPGRQRGGFRLVRAGRHGESVEHHERARAVCSPRTWVVCMACGVLPRWQDTRFGGGGRNREALGSDDRARAGHHSL